MLPPDLREFIALLNAEKVEYLIVGAHALGFHAIPRYTGDLDIFVRKGDHNAQCLMRVLDAFGFGTIGLSARDFQNGDDVIQLGVAPNRIDLLTELSGIDFDTAWANRVQDKLDGISTQFISRDDLIQNKQAAGRPQDLADIDTLKRS